MWRSLFCCCLSSDPARPDIEPLNLNAVIVDRGDRDPSNGPDIPLQSSPASHSSSSQSLKGGERRRGVSFAPDGFSPPPSPEIKTTDILSPRSSSRGIIKTSSFGGDPRSQPDRPSLWAPPPQPPAPPKPGKEDPADTSAILRDDML